MQKVIFTLHSSGGCKPRTVWRTSSLVLTKIVCLTECRFVSIFIRLRHVNLTCCLEIFNDHFFLLFVFFQRLIQKNSKIDSKILCFMGRWVLLVVIHVFLVMSVWLVKKVYFQNNKSSFFGTFKSIVLALKTEFFCFRLAVPPSYNERPIIFSNILLYRYWSFLSVLSAFLSMYLRHSITSALYGSQKQIR